MIEVKHHYGWVQLEKGETPYEHIRKTHNFLTDDNHDHEDTGDSIVVTYNKKSPQPSSNLRPAWATSNPGDFWFSLPYRTPEAKE